jgi:hypothetical protein
MSRWGRWSREDAEDHGYVWPCRGCGQITDTGWCGCQAGQPEPGDEDFEEGREIEEDDED